MTEDERVNSVTAIAHLARRAEDRVPDSYDLDEDGRLVVMRLHEDEHLQVLDLEGRLPAPALPRGTAVVHDPEDFAEYVNRLADADHTTVWAQPDRGRITAVLDDHASHVDAGWREHTVTLELQADPDWQRWMSRDNQPSNQIVLAEHLEDLAHTVVSPDAATMLEIATSFHAHRAVRFRSGVRVDSGDIQLSYEEETKAQAGRTGQMEIPQSFVISVSPWRGVEPVEITARLRWHIQEGQLSIRYVLMRPDVARDDLMRSLVGTVRDRVQPVPVLMGAAPSPVARRP